MNPEESAELRKPFPSETIGKLPKPKHRDNPKGNCNECGGWHGLPAVHLDYVGHAAVTDRLLKVDPEWTWEPFAVDGDGLPVIREGGLWIRLTICGVTRPGFGDGVSRKEMIGDAIRNAAMRFGVALDLWAKEDLHAFTPEPPPAESNGHAAPASADEGMAADGLPHEPEFHDNSGDAEATLDNLTARLAALPSTKRNKVERLRHKADLPRLDEEPDAATFTDWDALLRTAEAEVRA